MATHSSLTKCLIQRTRAIALSLQDSRPNGVQTHQEVIDVDSPGVDDEEARFQADIQRAIEESKQQPTTTTAAASRAPAPTVTPVPQPQTTALNTLAALMGAERAQMERDRLERLKRHRPDIHRNATTITVDSDSDSDEEERARGAKRQHISSSQSGPRRANASASSSSTTTQTATARARPAAATASGSASAAQTLFWDGELRQTANMHVDRQKDTRPLFRLTEILAPVGLVCFGRCIQPG